MSLGEVCTSACVSLKQLCRGRSLCFDWVVCKQETASPWDRKTSKWVVVDVNILRFQGVTLLFKLNKHRDRADIALLQPTTAYRALATERNDPGRGFQTLDMK